MDNLEERDFFISYNKYNKDWALWVYDVLREHNYTVYIQENDSEGNFTEWIKKAMKASKGFLAIWSNEYRNSEWCQKEWELAHNTKVKVYDNLELVLVERCELDPLYAHDVYVDFCNVSESGAEELLLRKIGYENPIHRNHIFPNTMQEDWRNFDAEAVHFSGEYYLSQYLDEGKPGPSPVKFFKRSASLGYMESHYRLGFLYENGIYCRRNYKKSCENYERAAIAGYLKAYIDMGRIYENGDFKFKADYKIASHCYESALSECPEANIYLGMLHQRGGPGLKRDFDTAERYYKTALESGLFEAYIYLGDLMQLRADGLVRTDRSRAAEYYQQSIYNYDLAFQNEFYEAYIRKGLLYEKNTFEKKDYLSAYMCYNEVQRCTSHGATRQTALLYMARLCENGLGVDKDLSRAYRFYNQSMRNGDDKDLESSAEDGQERIRTEFSSLKRFYLIGSMVECTAIEKKRYKEWTLSVKDSGGFEGVLIDEKGRLKEGDTITAVVKEFMDDSMQLSLVEAAP